MNIESARGQEKEYAPVLVLPNAQLASKSMLRPL